MECYKFVVIETIAHEKIYTVRATNKDEAFDKASVGEITGEVFVKNRGVMHRDVKNLVTD